MLTRRPSDRRLMPLRSALDMLFEDPWGEGGRWPDSALSPSMDLRETDEAFVVEVDLPGVRPDDAEVTLDGRTLVIRGQARSEREGNDQENGRYLVRERQSATFARAVTLPTEIDGEGLRCSFEHGELKVSLPKARQARSRRIPISGGAQGARSVGGPGQPAATGQPSTGGTRPTDETEGGRPG